MSMMFNNHNLTICEVLRQINDRLQGDAYNDIRDMLALCEQMAKRMTTKLREYNEKDDPEVWENRKVRDAFDRSLATYLTGNPDNARKILSK